LEEASQKLSEDQDSGKETRPRYYRVRVQSKELKGGGRGKESGWIEECSGRDREGGKEGRRWNRRGYLSPECDLFVDLVTLVT